MWALGWAFRNDKQNHPTDLARPELVPLEAGAWSVPSTGSGITRIGKLPWSMSVLELCVWPLWTGTRYRNCWLQRPPRLTRAVRPGGSGAAVPSPREQHGSQVSHECPRPRVESTPRPQAVREPGKCGLSLSSLQSAGKHSSKRSGEGAVHRVCRVPASQSLHAPMNPPRTLRHPSSTSATARPQQRALTPSLTGNGNDSVFICHHIHFGVLNWSQFSPESIWRSCILGCEP